MMADDLVDVGGFKRPAEMDLEEHHEAPATKKTMIAGGCTTLAMFEGRSSEMAKRRRASLHALRRIHGQDSDAISYAIADLALQGGRAVSVFSLMFQKSSVLRKHAKKTCDELEHAKAEKRMAKKLKKWRAWKDARAFAQELKIVTQQEWFAWAKTDAKPKDIPCNPNRIYKDWLSWKDWLGTEPGARARKMKRRDPNSYKNKSLKILEDNQVLAGLGPASAVASADDESSGVAIAL
eukprot:g4724.t1